jgi:hypothetical protein
MGVTKVTRNGTRVVTHRLCPRRTVAVTSEGASRTCGHWSGSSHRTTSSLLFSRCALCGDDLLSCLPDPGPPGFLSGSDLRPCASAHRALRRFFGGRCSGCGLLRGWCNRGAARCHLSGFLRFRPACSLRGGDPCPAFGAHRVTLLCGLSVRWRPGPCRTVPVLTGEQGAGLLKVGNLGVNGGQQFGRIHDL